MDIAQATHGYSPRLMDMAHDSFSQIFLLMQLIFTGHSQNILHDNTEPPKF